jgi:hypothetical protein
MRAFADENGMKLAAVLVIAVALVPICAAATLEPVPAAGLLPPGTVADGAGIFIVSIYTSADCGAFLCGITTYVFDLPGIIRGGTVTWISGSEPAILGTGTSATPVLTPSPIWIGGGNAMNPAPPGDAVSIPEPRTVVLVAAAIAGLVALRLAVKVAVPGVSFQNGHGVGWKRSLVREGAVRLGVPDGAHTGDDS